MKGLSTQFVYLIAALLVVGMAAVVPVYAEEPVNLLLNPGFEESQDGFPVNWHKYINGGADVTWTYVTDDPTAPEGTAYIRMSSNTPYTPNVYGSLAQRIQVKPRTVYRISLKVRVNQSGGAWVGGGPNWGTRIYLPNDTGGEWQVVEGTFVTGQETDWQFVMLVTDKTVALDIDDVSIVEVK